jgi:hypothetical protein
MHFEFLLPSLDNGENSRDSNKMTFWWVVNKTISYKLHLTLSFLISNTEEQLAKSEVVCDLEL